MTQGCPGELFQRPNTRFVRAVSLPLLQMCVAPKGWFRQQEGLVVDQGVLSKAVEGLGILQDLLLYLFEGLCILEAHG